MARHLYPCPTPRNRLRCRRTNRCTTGGRLNLTLPAARNLWRNASQVTPPASIRALGHPTRRLRATGSPRKNQGMTCGGTGLRPCDGAALDPGMSLQNVIPPVFLAFLIPYELPRVHSMPCLQRTIALKTSRPHAHSPTSLFSCVAVLYLAVHVPSLPRLLRCSIEVYSSIVDDSSGQQFSSIPSPRFTLGTSRTL